MLQGRLAPRGDMLRIALIHAVYGAGWAIVSIMASGGVSVAPAIAFLILAIGLAMIAVRRLRARAVAPEPLDPLAARWVRRIHVVTAVAALLYGWQLSGAGQEARAVAAVLVLLGAHFVPMWLVLRRSSLLAMGMALIVIGVLVWCAPAMAATGAFFAALIFSGNAVRLLLR
ncbi:hypothetical protein [Sphingomonas sp.]|uniref:hypothetical protein n=1 Tax=Sphingomonas sp. TaxID=28214 RepID=UPI000DB69D02|nr:hypothetical protein [Sphingomonas sp.]PZU11779.1 MAG: hypothetical protein DI605_02065 [Sphingomonas sp.]